MERSVTDVVMYGHVQTFCVFTQSACNSIPLHIHSTSVDKLSTFKTPLNTYLFDPVSYF